MQYWDCPSDEKYYRLLPQFTSDAAGIIFVYDCIYFYFIIFIPKTISESLSMKLKNYSI